MKRIISVMVCFLFCGSAWAQQPYPVSRQTFMKLDEVWAETVAFSRSLNEVIKDEAFSFQREDVVFLQRDLSGITFSLLTLITMIEMEFIHAESGQFNTDVLVYIDRFSSSLQDILALGLERNSQIIMVSEDKVMIDLYEKANQLLERAQNALAEITIAASLAEKSPQPGSDLLSELDELIETTDSQGWQEHDLVPENQLSAEKEIPAVALAEEDEDSIPPEGSWSMTRYNPSTGYISYYTRDGRLVGKEKKK